jgi:tetratricopeptide (TPR) repeat protein
VPKHEESDARRYAEQEMGKVLKPSEVSRFWIGRAASYVLSDPGGEAKLVFRKFLLALNPYEVPDNYNQYYFSRYSWLFRGFLPSFFVVAPFAVIGMLASVGRWRRTGFLHLYVLAYFVSLLLLYVTSRYRLPIMVGLIPFAGNGVVETIRAFREQGWPSVLKPAAIIFAVTLLGSFLPIEKPGFAKQGSEVAEFYARQGNYDAADRALQTAIAEAGPTELHLVYFNQGIFYANTGRLEESMQSLEKSLAVDPSFEQARVKLEQVRSRISESRSVTN